MCVCCRDILDRSLKQLCEFEAAYGAALNDLREKRSMTRPMSPAPGGGGGALVSVNPPSTAEVAEKVSAVHCVHVYQSHVLTCLDL